MPCWLTRENGMASDALALQFVSFFSLRKALYGARTACQTSTMGHPPWIPVRLRWEQSVIYFVTICVKDRKQVLAGEAAFNALKNAAARLREWRVLAAILMPIIFTLSLRQVSATADSAISALR
ncbi:MAG: hypothetical protein DME55_03425 [Verrucomicrobia bacterium]|nr:MAG: hypothetical protein DME55_03425 [Verrucomicrobiota bacterium]